MTGQKTDCRTTGNSPKSSSDCRLLPVALDATSLSLSLSRCRLYGLVKMSAHVKSSVIQRGGGQTEVGRQGCAAEGGGKRKARVGKDFVSFCHRMFVRLSKWKREPVSSFDFDSLPLLHRLSPLPLSYTVRLLINMHFGRSGCCLWLFSLFILPYNLSNESPINNAALLPSLPTSTEVAILLSTRRGGKSQSSRAAAAIDSQRCHQILQSYKRTPRYTQQLREGEEGGG